MKAAPPNSLVNGIASDYININDRALHYGDGLFETILCSKQKLFYWSQHYARLQASAQRLKIACPQEQVLLDDITKLVKDNPSDSNYTIKIIISRGAGERGYQFTDKTSVTRLVLLSELDSDYSALLSKELVSGELYLCEQQVSINKNLAGLKHLNRLENVLARNEWSEPYIDGLMLNENKHVIEASMSNLFAVKDSQLFTPDLTLSGVNGIMREMILRLAQESNIKTSVIDLTLHDLRTMDELFISNSLLGMKSVNKLGDILYNQRTLTDKIFSALLNTMENHDQVI